MDFISPVLAADFLGKPVWLWLSFLAIVAALLAFDLGVLHRKEREVKVAESLWLSAAYIAVGLAFGAWVWAYAGAESGMQYLAGFLVEKTLAIDNVFIFAALFTLFAIPSRYQHRVLFWGVLGVIVLRGIMIGFGTFLVTEFSWILYVFGAFLIVTGVRMLLFAHQTPDLASNPVLRWMRRHLRITEQLHGKRFWVELPAPDIQGGPPSSRPGAPRVRWATPLLLTLVLIEVIDVIFAVDSLPAIFALTQDPFVVYTSNIFAILGLRALYFALAAMIDRFRYLKYALALVLVLIGIKLCVVNVVGKIPAWIPLTVTLGLLIGGVLYSLYREPLAARPARKAEGLG